MTRSLSLNGTWGLIWAEGSPLNPPDYFTGENLHGWRLLEAEVPAPIHKALMDKGLIEDPNFGMNSLKARWVEEMFWIYRRSFEAPEDALSQTAWLVFEKLELDAVVLLNGQEVGRHANAHRPARFEVTGKLRPGENLLVVKLSTGLHSASDKQAKGYNSGEIGLLTKRHWHRHPQCQSGWDWQPRLVNVGILGDVRLEWSAVPRLDHVTVFAVPSADLSTAAMHIRASVEGISDAPADAVLRARIVETGQEASLSLQVPRGESRHEIALEIENPRLWWPIGHGEQFRHTVEVTLEAGGEKQSVTRKTGIRRVEMDQSPHPVEGRYCTLKINNRPIFCKGGNWVPADMLYSTVTAQRYRELVDLAVQANFNLLRIWGGGLFADHALCDACDEAGILIWHDFLFACAQYPGQDPEFVREVHREITLAVRELAHHPSLVVWCGNNEIEWGDWNWNYDNSNPAHPHYALFHRDIPRIVQAEDPSTIHWISSPWSPDLKQPNDPTVGDQHPWAVSIGGAGGADWWHYRTNADRFPNEGGVLGASSPATLRQFLPENERYIHSPSWDHHDNCFAALDPGPGGNGRAYKTVELWTGRDTLSMDWQEYAFWSGMLQAEGLCEYILNYRRRMFSSASAVFWMYNDCWPATHTWTIVDYYLRKKLSYHPVRRAFQPVTVVVAEENGMVTVYGVNDTPEGWSGELRYGLFTLAGERPLDERISISLPANASTVLAGFPRAEWEKLGLTRSGAFAVLIRDGKLVAQHRLFLERFKDLEFADPKISLSVEQGTLTLASDAFAWSVCLDLDGEAPLADNCFDLLPGIPYQMPWDSSLGEPSIVRVANRP